MSGSGRTTFVSMHWQLRHRSKDKNECYADCGAAGRYVIAASAIAGSYKLVRITRDGIEFLVSHAEPIALKQYAAIDLERRMLS
jgi:hypothetical protein